MARRLTEGPGAGYTIEGKLMYNPKINSYEVIHQSKYAYEIACDIDSQLCAGATAYSYYYGGEIDEFIPVKITGLVFVSIADEDIDINESEIRDSLDNIKFRTLVGTGYAHQTFDGDLSTDDITDNSYGYSNFYVLGIDMQITDRQIIDYIDDLVTGKTIDTFYTAFDEDDDVADTFDYEEDAIDFAETNDDIMKITKDTTSRAFDGTLDIIDTETVWERF